MMLTVFRSRLKPENQDAKTSHILWLGGVGVSNRRKQGVMGGIDIADGGDADRLGQAFGRDAETDRQIHPRQDAKLGPAERRVGDHIGDERGHRRVLPHLACKLVGDVGDGHGVGTDDHQRDRAQAVQRLPPRV